MNATLDTKTPSPLVLSAAKQAGLGDIAEKVLAQERLSFEDGMRLYEHPDLTVIGGLANAVRERWHGDITYFNRNLHINATNVCEATCMFCSLQRG